MVSPWPQGWSEHPPPPTSLWQIKQAFAADSMLPEGPLPEGPLPEGPLPEGPLPEGPLSEGPLPEGPPLDPPEAGLGLVGWVDPIGAAEISGGLSILPKFQP
jgi:hypothetical protein